VKRPRALRPGDRVAVLAPASSFDRSVFDQGIIELRTLGFEPVFDESVFERSSYLAGSPQKRAKAFRTAWKDPSIAGLFTVRGGYGSAQLLPLLDIAELRCFQKAFLGSSDLTALLICLTNHCETVSFHGPMLVNFAKQISGYDRSSLLGCLSVPKPLGELAPDGVEVLKAGEASGMLLGGTLTQLLASLATPYAFSPPDGYILLLDDINERPYRIDRMLTQIQQAGLLRLASAVVCTEFLGCDDEEQTAKSILLKILSDFNGPVLFGFPSGHTNRPMLTLPLGVRVTVISTPYPRLIVEEAAVE